MSTSAATLPLSMTSSGGIHDTTAHRTVTSCYDTTTSYEQSRRQVSSVVVSEQVIGELPESGGIKYVEVPVIEEVIKRVPKKEIIEVEKVVPKYEVEYVERVVEVPQIHYIDKQVERPTVQEILIHKPVKQIQEIPREVIKTVPKIETVVVEKIVNVPGQVVEVGSCCNFHLMNMIIELLVTCRFQNPMSWKIKFPLNDSKIKICLWLLLKQFVQSLQNLMK